MRNFRKVLLIILDGLGIGPADDFLKYHSEPCNTLGHIAKFVGGLKLSNLEAMGLGNLSFVPGIQPTREPVGSYGMMIPRSAGCDTFAGVWEMCGVIYKKRLTSFYPDIPSEVVQLIESTIHTPTLCNAYISGFRALDKYADKHFETGRPIVYTCDDGVILIAAHELVVPVCQLHKMGKLLSEALKDLHLARIITRPFVGQVGSFVRTDNRKDFIVAHPLVVSSLLSVLRKKGIRVTASEHLATILGRESVTDVIKGVKDNYETIEDIKSFISSSKEGLGIFILQDFDMCGHKKDPHRFAELLIEFDDELEQMVNSLGNRDVLIITADHGCDPTVEIRGHTREKVPLLVVGSGIKGANLGTRSTFADLGQTIADIFGCVNIEAGDSFEEKIKK